MQFQPYSWMKVGYSIAAVSLPSDFLPKKYRKLHKTRSMLTVLRHMWRPRDIHLSRLSLCWSHRISHATGLGGTTLEDVLTTGANLALKQRKTIHHYYYILALDNKPSPDNCCLSHWLTLCNGMNDCEVDRSVPSKTGNAWNATQLCNHTSLKQQWQGPIVDGSPPYSSTSLGNWLANPLDSHHREAKYIHYFTSLYIFALYAETPRVNLCGLFHFMGRKKTNVRSTEHVTQATESTKLNTL